MYAINIMPKILFETNGRTHELSTTYTEYHTYHESCQIRMGLCCYQEQTFRQCRICFEWGHRSKNQTEKGWLKDRRCVTPGSCIPCSM